MDSDLTHRPNSIMIRYDALDNFHDDREDFDIDDDGDDEFEKLETYLQEKAPGSEK